MATAPWNTNDLLTNRPAEVPILRRILSLMMILALAIGGAIVTAGLVAGGFAAGIFALCFIVALLYIAH